MLSTYRRGHNYEVTAFYDSLPRAVQTLKYFRVKGFFKIDEQRVGGALNDLTLESSCIVKYQEFLRYPSSRGGLNRKILYYSTLNHFGRHGLTHGESATKKLCWIVSRLCNLIFTRRTQ
jgi:hypothetical protein